MFQSFRDLTLYDISERILLVKMKFFFFSFSKELNRYQLTRDSKLRSRRKISTRFIHIAI